MTTVAPSKAPSLPTSVAASVSSVDLLQVEHVHAHRHEADAATTAPPAAEHARHDADPVLELLRPSTPSTLPPAYGTTTFADRQSAATSATHFRAAYDVAPSLTGKGQSVAIIDCVPLAARSRRT